MSKWSSGITLFSSVQWLFFIFANTVVVPISIANAFHLSPEIAETMLRSSMIFTGAACILQAAIGHRLPIMEGHSGLLWGVILNLGMSASSMGYSLPTIGGGIATGIFLACAVSVLIALFNWLRFLHAVFSPMVLSVYLFLLTFQLIFIFFKGMFPLEENGTIAVPESILSLFIVLVVCILKLRGSQIISNFSILIGILLGWFCYDLLFIEEGIQQTPSASFSLGLFPLGTPNLEAGIIIVSFFAFMMNFTNTLTSIGTVSTMLNEKASNQQYRRSIFVTSMLTAVGTTFGMVPFTPFTSSIGFLQSTRIFERKPFFIGGGLLTLFGIIPLLGSFLAKLPITIGNAVLFVAYLQLFGTAFNSLNGKVFNSNTIFRLAVPVLIGLSIMNLPPSVFASLPALIQPIISNGLIIGVLLSMILENLVNWSMFEKFEMRNH